jgi:tetratricopeptide (TPR) repeat protein
LGVFVGGWTLAAAEAICGGWGMGGGDWDNAAPTPNPPSPVLDGLAALLDKSLLKQEEGVAGEPRLTMLETIREYALERLEMSGEAEALRRRHADYYVTLAEQAAPWLTHAERRPWLEHLGVEYTNLRAALAWECEQAPQNQMALQLAGDLTWFWYFRGEWSEGRSWLEKVLAYHHTGGALDARAHALDGAGWLAALQGDYVRAHVWLTESEALWRARDQHVHLARNQFFLGFTTLGLGNIAEASARYEESIALCHDMDDRWCLALSLFGLGDAMKHVGGGTAQAHFEASLVVWREVGDAWGIALLLVNLGDVALQQGDYVMARAYEEEALLLLRESGEQSMTAWALCYLGHIARHQEDYERAEAYFTEGLMLFQQLGHQPGRATILSNLGNIAFYHGNHARAVALLHESLTVFGELKDKQGIPECLEGIARLASVAGQHPAGARRAARLYGAADAWREAAGLPLSPVHRAAYKRDLAVTRDQLDEVAWATAWAEGRALLPDQAIAEAEQALVETEASAADRQPDLLPPTPPTKS